MGDVDAPPPRDYGAETRETLQAQVELAPDLYAAEREFSPLYADLSAENVRRSLLGVDGKGGLLKTFEDVAPRTQALQDQAQQAQRRADVRSLEELGAPTIEALRNADPQQKLLMDRLNVAALQDLEAGYGLDPALRAETEQNVRAAQAARGVGWGNADATAEAFAVGERGLALRTQRMLTAQNQARLNAATGADPALAILGRPSQGAAQGQALLGQGQQQAGNLGPTLFSPESPYAADVFNTNFNSQAAADIASANNRTALIGAGISSAGSAASSM